MPFDLQHLLRFLSSFQTNDIAFLELWRSRWFRHLIAQHPSKNVEIMLWISGLL